MVQHDIVGIEGGRWLLKSARISPGGGTAQGGKEPSIASPPPSNYAVQRQVPLSLSLSLFPCGGRWPKHLPEKSRERERRTTEGKHPTAAAAMVTKAQKRACSLAHWAIRRRHERASSRIAGARFHIAIPLQLGGRTRPSSLSIS